MPLFEISSEDLQKLKELFVEMDTYEDREDENGETEPWDFDDVDEQAEIGWDIIGIIRPILEKI